ncbi:MAG: Protein hit [archaeon]|jgi:histidine triad (HIT) family protein
MLPMTHESDCIFCQIAHGKIPSKKVYDDENFFAILDIHPKAEGHTLIIPKKHYKTMLDMPSSLGGELMDAIKKVSFDIIDKKQGEGVNVCSNIGEPAGQVVHHAHVHVIPRKKDDGLKNLV